MVDKNFIGLDKPDITRFESYLPTAFSSELTLLQKVNKIIQDLNRNFDLTNEMVEYLNRFIETFDEKLYETIEDVLTVWLEDGRLADIVRVAISEEVIEARTDYLGKKYVDLKERLDSEKADIVEVASQLQQTMYLLKSNETLQETLNKGYSSVLVQNRELTISSSVVIPTTTKKIIFVNATITRSQTLVSETNYPIMSGSSLNGLTIEGVEFIGDNYKSSDGGANVSGHSSLFIENSKNIRVNDCVFKNTGLYGVEFYNCDNVVVENNQVESTQEPDGTRGRYGIAFIKSRQCVARNNTLKYISVGLYSGLRGTDGVHYQDVKDIIFEQNHFISNTENAIYGEGYKGLKIVNNTFINARSVAVKIRGIDVTIANNIIQTNRTAITIAVLSQNVVVTGNTIEMLPNANDNMGIILSMSGLRDYLTVRSLDTSLRGTDFIISNNIIKAANGNIPNICHGVFLSGDNTYSTVGDFSLQNVLIDSNIMVGLKNGVYLPATQTVEKITIKNNKMSGLSPTSTDTYDYNGVGVYYGAYTPNLVVENNVIERFFNGLVFDSRAASFGLCTVLNNIFRDNTNYCIDYEKSFSGVGSHKSEGNTFHSNGVGRVNNPPLQSVGVKTLVGSDSTGANVYSANDLPLGKNEGFISLFAEDGRVVQVPYWVVIHGT